MSRIINLFNKQHFLIKRLKALNDSGASLVLEALIVLPAFLMLLIVFINSLQLLQAQFILSKAVSNTVTQVSTHYYPIELATDQYNELDLEGRIKEWVQEWFPLELEPLWELAKPIAESTFENYKNKLIKQLLTTLIINKVNEEGGLPKLNKQNIEITSFHLSGQNETERYLLIEVNYRYSLPIPLFVGHWKLNAKAKERLWIGNI